MNYKSILKRESKLMLFVVVGLIVAVIGTSYALFLKVHNNTNNQVVTAGTLQITFTDGTKISATSDSEESCLYPKENDETGKNKGCKYNFSAYNSGNLPVQYSVVLKDMVVNNTGISTNLLDHQWIKYSLKKTINGNTEEVVNGAKLETLTNTKTSQELFNSYLPVGQTVQFQLTIWLDPETPEENSHKYVYLELNVDQSVYEAGDVATSNLLSNLGVNGLSEVMSDVTTVSEVSLARMEYRYTGAEPKNYVTFNDELWRILGIYNVDGKRRIKLIRNDTLTSAWDTNNGTDFTSSSLHTYLNTLLKDSAKNLVADAPYYLGGDTDFNINSKAMYGIETVSNQITSTVGLMSLSDYAFGADISGSVRLTEIADKNNVNWLYKNQNEWLINKNDSNQVYAINSDGTLTQSSDTNTEKGVRPVVYLDENVKIASGAGTKSEPFVFEK